MSFRGLHACFGVTTDTMPDRRLLDDIEPGPGTEGQLKALRREMSLIWDAHEREHEQHEQAHAREHAFAQQAIDTAAVLARENKTDANEWRGSMNDREGKFATKTDVAQILERLDKIERAGLVAAERDRAREATAAEDKLDTERRVSRSQWVIGLVVGLLATVGAVLVNLVLRLAGN